MALSILDLRQLYGGTDGERNILRVHILVYFWFIFVSVDRLRSLRYFVTSAEEASFSGAARRLNVTTPAVAKLVGALERDLRVALFDRSVQGLKLTAAGQHYLESCKPHIEMLEQIDEQMRGANTRPRGVLVVGVQHVAARQLLAPALPRFHARHPDIEVDLREATQMRDADTPGIDVFLSLAWPKSDDMIHRPLVRSRHNVCAAPAYWSAHGMPREPRELTGHDCLLIRSQTGTVMDVWAFERDGVREDVTVAGWFVCANAHRDVAIELAIAGLGVVRILDWTNREALDQGALMPALTEWDCPDAPPIVLSYRPTVRRIARVRAFIDFVRGLFQGLEGPAASAMATAPRWAGSHAPRASSLTRSRR